MKISKRRIATLISLLFLLTTGASAQNFGSVTLKLEDAKTGEPVGFATVSLTPKGGESAKQYILSDSEGVARMTKIKKGTYTIKAELLGYKPYEKEISIEKRVDLGVIKMKEDPKLLDAASVSAVGNPIIMKKDTIEYNASSFKISDNDMLEDLLKKLPGVEISSDGTVTANGQTISKITIDGKTFFLDDPQLATKNIPAKIVERVKVVEKRSDQALFTGIDDGQEETVIDLSIYEGMMDGWFGNIMAGGGHDVPDGDWRYQGAGILGNFKEDSQISIIVNGNNTNNRGFNDLAGGMMQGMRGGGGGMGRGSNMFGSSNGVTTSWMGGLNGAWDLLDDAMELSGNYLYNGSEKYVEESSSKITFLENGNRLLNNNSGFSTTNTQGHRVGARIDHEFSKNTSILFEPQFNIGYGSFIEHSDFSTRTAMGRDTLFTNKGFSDNTGENRNWSTSGRLLFRQRLGKAGRTISAMFNYKFSDNSMRGFNQSLTGTDLDGDNIFENDIVNQRYDQISKSSSLSGRLVYTEPITEHLFLEANYEYGWNTNQSSKDIFNSGSTVVTDGTEHLVYDPNGEQFDPTYSNSILNRYINQKGGASLSWQGQKLNAQIGAQVNPTNTHNETNGELYDSKVVNWSPQARIRYMANKNTNLMLSYDGRSGQPTTSQLMPVPDNTDPLNITFGNPNLNPYFDHNMRLMFRYTNMKTFTSVNVHLNGSMVQDVITTAQWYDKAGTQYSIPINGPTSGNINGRVMVNSPIGKSNFSIMSMTNGRYSQSTSYLGKEGFQLDKYYDPERAEFDYAQFNADYPDIDKSNIFTSNTIRTMSISQMLRLTYRNDFVELIGGGRTNLSKSWYSIQTANTDMTWNNNVSFEMNWTLPFGMNLISDLNYNWYNGYTTPQEAEFILNAEITQLIMNKKATIAIRGYDLLNQAKNIFVTDAADYHQEVRNNTLGRYLIVSFTYRFGTFNEGRRGPGGNQRGRMQAPPGR